MLALLWKEHWTSRKKTWPSHLVLCFSSGNGKLYFTCLFSVHGSCKNQMDAKAFEKCNVPFPWIILLPLFYKLLPECFCWRELALLQISFL